MRRYSVLIITALFTLAFMTNTFASNGIQIGTVGARATAMGSNVRGLADDWSAMFFNPAGLTQLGKWSIGVSTALIMPGGSYTAYNYPTAPTETPPSFPFAGMYTDARDASDKKFYIPSIGIFFKPIEKLTVGLGMYVPFGLGTEWDIFYVPSGYGNTDAISKEKEHYSDLQVINIQPTLAYKITDNISVGLGVSYVLGQMTLDRVVTPLNPLLEVWSDPQMAPLVQVLGPIQEDQYRLIFENNMEGDGSTIGANFGILIDIMDNLSFGLSAQYSPDINMTGKLKQTLALPGDPTKVATISQLQQVGIISAEDAQDLSAMFSGQNDSQELDAEADFPLPWTIGGGIAYKPIPKLTLTADVSLTNWSSWDEIDIILDGEDEPVTLKAHWNNTVEMGIGLEFVALDRESSKLAIRGGFYTVGSPVPNETIDPTILDPNRRYDITAGLGLDLGLLSINLTTEYILFGDNDIPSSDYAFDAETGVADNYAGLYEFNALVVTLGTSIQF